MLRTLPESYKCCWHEHLNKVVSAYNCTRNDSTGYSPFFLLYGRHPRLPIDLIFNLDQWNESKGHTEVTNRWKAAMEEAYVLAQRQSSASAVRNKRYYDKKARYVDIQPHDRVLVRNLSERGGPGKLRTFWEKEVYVVVRCKDPLSPVYKVRRETGKGHSQVLHRNLPLPCNDLPIEDPAPAQKSHKNACQHRNRRSRVSPRLQNRTSPAERTKVEEDSSSRSDEEVIAIMHSENPFGESQETTQDNRADHSDSNNQQNEMPSEHDELNSAPLHTTVDQIQNDSIESGLRLDEGDSQSNNQSKQDKRSTRIRQQPSRSRFLSSGNWL